MVDEFAKAMEMQTQSACISKRLGLVDFGTCSRQTGGMGAGSENSLRDIVDWPQDMRDGYVMTDVSTVINSYTVGGLRAMSELGRAGGGAESELPLRAQKLSELADRVAAAMNSLLPVSYDPRGLSDEDV